MTTTVYLSLGSNLGDRRANLEAGIHYLGMLGKVTAISSIYETEPVELREQPWFLNCVVELATDVSAEGLLTSVRRIENDLGRTREAPKGPRTIDVDILLFGSAVIATADLQIPHPAMHKRRFVLEPLAEIAPAALHPVLAQSARDLLAQLGAQAGFVKRLAT